MGTTRLLFKRPGGGGGIGRDPPKEVSPGGSGGSPGGGSGGTLRQGSKIGLLFEVYFNGGGGWAGYCNLSE